MTIFGRPRNCPTSDIQRVWNGPAPIVALPEKAWYKIQNVGQNAADMWIYDEIGGWGVTAQNLVAQLAELNVAQINVHLNSPGGDVFDGIAILNSLRDHPANVTVTVDALAASIASVIAQAGNKIIMGRNSTMMIHNASGFAMGEAKDLRKMAQLLEDTTANIASIYAERAGGTPKQWLAVMDGETWYSADEAVAAGLADEVAPLPTEASARAQAAKFDMSNYAHAPKITAGCPTCTGSTRETTDMVCQTCGTDYAPEPGPVIQVAWDPSAFKAALTAAIPAEPEPVAFDADLFKGAMSLVINNVPASEPAPTPEPARASVFDPGVFAAAIRKARS